MALIIEDGTGVANANSYITVAEARDFATLRGSTLPATDADVEKLIIKGFDYIEVQQYKGVPVYDFITAWPRDEVIVNNNLLDNTLIPPTIKKAQSLLTIEAQTVDLMPTGTGQEVIKEKVDVVEVSYAESGKGVNSPIFTQVDALLKPLLGYSMNLKLVRV